MDISEIRLDLTTQKEEKKEEIIVTVDSGKMNTKGYIETKDGEGIKSVFRTNVVETTNVLDKKCTLIKDEVTYAVGDLNYDIREEDHLETRKDTNMHFICTLKMIADLLNEGGYNRKGECIALGINVPVRQYLIKEERQKFVELYLGNHEFYIGGDFYSVSITSVEPYFEGLGFLINNLSRYKDRRFILVENGGYECTHVEINNLMPQSGAGSITFGSHKLINDILVKYSNFGMTRDQVLDVLDRNGKTHFTSEIEEAFNSATREHVENIYKRLNSIKRAALTEYAFTGGATSIYKPYLEQFFPHREFSEESLYDNVTGAHKKMKTSKLAKKSKLA